MMLAFDALNEAMTLPPPSREAIQMTIFFNLSSK